MINLVLCKNLTIKMIWFLAWSLVSDLLYINEHCYIEMIMGAMLRSSRNKRYSSHLKTKRNIWIIRGQAMFPRSPTIHDPDLTIQIKKGFLSGSGSDWILGSDTGSHDPSRGSCDLQSDLIQSSHVVQVANKFRCSINVCKSYVSIPFLKRLKLEFCFH